MSLQSKIKTASEIWHKDGWRGIKTKIAANRLIRQQRRDYQIWIEKYDSLTDSDRLAIKQRIADLPLKPLISVVLPVYNIEEKWLRICLDSVLKQLYPHWELCIADDCSPRTHIRPLLEEYAARDPRIKIAFRSENGHISAASNTALELASGDFAALLDHDDELSEHALYFVAEEINRFPDTQMIYSDEDMIDEQGKRYDAKFKPDWSPDLFYSLNLITHLSVYRTEILRRIGGFRIGLEGSQDYDLALRVIEQIKPHQIRHIPHILYHWRAISGSVALASDEKPYAHQRARQAIREHFERTGKKVEVRETSFNYHRVSYKLPDVLPKVSIFMPDEDFLQTIDYPNFEKICVKETNNKAEKLNQAVSQSNGEVLCFFDVKMKLISNDWLKEMVSFALQKEIGAVGAKIYFPDLTSRHNGIIFGINDLFGFPFRGFMRDIPNVLARTHAINNFSAISGVLVIRRDLFMEIGGFNKTNFPQGLFAIDLCLRLREKNYRNVFTPYAEFIQTEDSPIEKIIRAKNSTELSVFRKKWQKIIENDEFYNPNLSLKDESFSIEMPPRIKKPWRS